MRSFLTVFLTMVFLSFSFVTASTDETTEGSAGIVVSEAMMEAAEKGSESNLRFKLTNFTSRRLVLVDVRFPAAKGAEIVMTTGSDKDQPIEQLHILPEETLNLKSSHIAIRAIDLKKDLRSGMDVQFELVFADSTTRAFAHVH